MDGSLHLPTLGNYCLAPSSDDPLAGYYFVKVPQNADDLVIEHLKFDLCCIADVVEEV